MNMDYRNIIAESAKAAESANMVGSDAGAKKDALETGYVSMENLIGHARNAVEVVISFASMTKRNITAKSALRM